MDYSEKVDHAIGVLHRECGLIHVGSRDQDILLVQALVDQLGFNLEAQDKIARLLKTEPLEKRK